jgi:hypothetical protein
VRGEPVPTKRVAAEAVVLFLQAPVGPHAALHQGVSLAPLHPEVRGCLLEGTIEKVQGLLAVLGPLCVALLLDGLECLAGFRVLGLLVEVVPLPLFLSVHPLPHGLQVPVGLARLRLLQLPFFLP